MSPSALTTMPVPTPVAGTSKAENPVRPIPCAVIVTTDSLARATMADRSEPSPDVTAATACAIGDETGRTLTAPVPNTVNNPNVASAANSAAMTETTANVAALARVVGELLAAGGGAGAGVGE